MVNKDTIVYCFFILNNLIITMPTEGGKLNKIE